MATLLHTLATTGGLTLVFLLANADFAQAGGYYGGYGHYGGHHGYGHYGHSRGGHGGYYGRHHGYRYGGYARHSYRSYRYGHSGYGRSYYAQPHRYYGRSYGYRPHYYGHSRSYSNSYRYRSPSGYSDYGNTDHGRRDYDSPSRPGTIDSPDYGGDEAYSSLGSAEEGPSTSYGGSWSLLAARRYTDALRAFGEEAESNPANGVPKVGYALASAATGDLERGVWAMRRACRIDPESMHNFVLTKGVQPVVRRLIDRYQDPSFDGDVRDRDSAFMLASLHYLAGDEKSAQDKITLAFEAGDRSASAANLARIVEAKLARGSVDEEGSLLNHEAPEPVGPPTEDAPLPMLPSTTSESKNAA